MSTIKETEQSFQIEALAATFKKWGWDESIPRVISGWGNFVCSDIGFDLRINHGEAGQGAYTELVLSSKTKIGSSEQVKNLDFYYRGLGGKELEIGGSPVKGMSVLNRGEGRGIGSLDQPRLLISLFDRFGEDAFRIAIYPTGEICSIRRSFSEEYDESVGIKTGAPVVLGY